MVQKVWVFSVWAQVKPVQWCKCLYDYVMATSKCLAPFRFHPKDFKFAKQSGNVGFGVPNVPRQGRYSMVNISSAV